MTKLRLDILARPLFILALGLLLLNDFYLKYEYSNFLTGKLSDLAGLFLFPYFFSSFRIKWTKIIYLATAVLFIFWKSELSQSLIIWFQTIGIGFNRVVDHTDLFALLILPPSYIYFQKKLKSKPKIHKALTLPISIVTLFAIWATTLPRQKVELNRKVDEVYAVNVSKTELFKLMPPGYGYSDTLEKNIKDRLFYLHFEINEHYHADVTGLSTITSKNSSNTVVRLDTILHGYITGGLFTGVDQDEVEHFKSISTKEFKTYFNANFIKPINNGNAEHIHFDNKEIHDSYENQ